MSGIRAATLWPPHTRLEGELPSLWLKSGGKLLKGGVTQWWDSQGTGRITWDSQGTGRISWHTRMSRLDVPNPSVSLCPKAASPLLLLQQLRGTLRNRRSLWGQTALQPCFFSIWIPIRQTSLYCLVEANTSMGICHFPNLEQFLTSWKQQNKQHLICKLLALDSVPRGGGKLRR